MVRFYGGPNHSSVGITVNILLCKNQDSGLLGFIQSSRLLCNHKKWRMQSSLSGVLGNLGHKLRARGAEMLFVGELIEESWRQGMSYASRINVTSSPA